MKIVCISDTHGMYDDLEMPEGDVLVHAGDIMGHGRRNYEIKSFNRWLGTLDYEHKIVIAGNHDWLFQTNREYTEELMTNATYLQDSSVVIDGVKFYGSPWQPEFYNWAFNLERGEELKEKWDMIDEDTDVLITHGPAWGHLDVIGAEQVGCEELAYAIERVKPSYHIFGHIHYSYGTEYSNGVNYINAATCTEAYKPDNPPIVFTYGEDVD